MVLEVFLSEKPRSERLRADLHSLEVPSKHLSEFISVLRLLRLRSSRVICQWLLNLKASIDAMRVQTRRSERMSTAIDVTPRINLRHCRCRRMPLFFDPELHLSLRHMMPRPDAWKQIDQKRKDVCCEDESDGPFDDGSCIRALGFAENTEGDGEAEFDEDEDQFDPKGEAQDLMVAVFDAEALVFGADEDCGYNISAPD